jgi:uncharacterized membrane protein
MAEPVNLESFVQRCFEEAWELFKKDVILYLLSGLIVIVIGGVTLGVLMGPLLVGFIQIVRRRQKGEMPTAGEVFAGMQSFLPAFLAALLIGVCVFLGSMLFILPGLAVAYVAMFTFHFIAFKNAPVGSAIAGSFGLIQEQFAATLVLFVLVGILNGLGGAIMFGALLTFPFGLLVLTVAFEKLTGHTDG